MAEFLVELYVSSADPDVVGHAAERTRIAADELTREGTHVRFVRSIYLPHEETCFLLYEASSVAAVHAVAQRAGLAYERISETTSTETRRTTT